jgi:hypothetical protein
MLVYDQETVDGAPIEETEQVQNPVTPQGGQVAAVNCMLHADRLFLT